MPQAINRGREEIFVRGELLSALRARIQVSQKLKVLWLLGGQRLVGRNLCFVAVNRLCERLPRSFHSAQSFVLRLHDYLVTDSEIVVLHHLQFFFCHILVLL